MSSAMWAAIDGHRFDAALQHHQKAASLGHARHAAIHGLTGDTNAVQRSLGHAQDALDRADPGTPGRCG
ncbi:hypothetical protein [Kitasatospora cineracea]|uniref:hypothetical protein n=1 Tax=Kitasatospora cineracea TaxID=88074 RepID=UPI0033C2C271